MLPYWYGFPLWFPQPKSSLPIWVSEARDRYRQRGSHHCWWLFNIWRVRNDPLNPQDLPDDFDTFQRPLRRVSGQDVFDPCSALCSGAIKFNTNLDSWWFHLLRQWFLLTVFSGQRVFISLRLWSRGDSLFTRRFFQWGPWQWIGRRKSHPPISWKLVCLCSASRRSISKKPVILRHGLHENIFGNSNIWQIYARPI